MQVKAHDRHNIGTAVAIDDHAGSATVQFTSATGTTAIRELGWDQLEIVTPRQPAPRNMSSDAEASLDRIIAPHRRIVDRATELLAEDGLRPGDAQRWERTARDRIDRAAQTIAADPPDWITDQLGARPDWPAAAQVWDDTIRDVATQLEHGTSPEEAGVVLDDAADWLHDHPAPLPTSAHVRSVDELDQRRRELQALFATAPPDQRDLVAELRTPDTGTSDANAQLLAAVETQDARTSWITTHWPEVVEAGEIERGVGGPEVDIE